MLLILSLSYIPRSPSSSVSLKIGISSLDSLLVEEWPCILNCWAFLFREEKCFIHFVVFFRKWTKYAMKNYVTLAATIYSQAKKLMFVLDSMTIFHELFCYHIYNRASIDSVNQKLANEIIYSFDVKGFFSSLLYLYSS